MLLLTLMMACSTDPEPPAAVEPEPSLQAMAPEPIEEPEVLVEADVLVEAEEEATSEEDSTEALEEAQAITDAQATTPIASETDASAEPVVAQAPDEAVLEEPATDEAVPPYAVREGAAASATAEGALPEAARAVATGPVNYVLQTGSSSLYVQVFKDTTTAASGISHDHVMRASGWTGTATWDPTNPENCKIDISVPVDKLVVDPSKLREAVGYDSTLSDGQRGDVRNNMLSKDQLNSSKYGEISFSATRCKVASEGKVDVRGELTIKGNSKPVSLRMTLDADADSFSAKGGFMVNGSDYGLEPFSAMMGALKNKDELRFTVRLSGKAR
ncbi:MAG: polyisoprenoid-binding protein YceI [Cognaticolwellia sp.]|jgi:polyisoprenoid-binding protein YceI